MTDAEKRADLIRRLRDDDLLVTRYEAVTLIESQAGEIARLREALEEADRRLVSVVEWQIPDGAEAEIGKVLLSIRTTLGKGTP